MSLLLDSKDTQPKGIEVKTHGKLSKKELREVGMQNSRILSKDIVLLGDYEIDAKDFLEAAFYVLTNTDLRRNDPRLKFVKEIKRLDVLGGYNKQYNNKSKRLGYRQR